MGTWGYVFIIFVVYAVISYVVGFIDWCIYLWASSVFSYRYGYPPLLVGLVSLILLLSDIVLYILVFRWFIVKRIRSLSTFDLRKFVESFIVLSIPVQVLSLPMVVIGVCGVLAEDIFYNSVVFITLYWGAILSVYSLFIHPFCAPCCALAINLYIDTEDNLRGGIFKALKKSSKTIPYIFAVSIIVWLVTTVTTAIIIRVAPILSEPIILLQQPLPHAAWAGTWYNIALKSMPRYYHLIMNPISYLIYASIFRRLAREKLNEILNY